MKIYAIIIIWAVVAFLLALVINLPFWGVIFAGLGRSYWSVLFFEGLWAFLVGGIVAPIIMYFVYEQVS